MFPGHSVVLPRAHLSVRLSSKSPEVLSRICTGPTNVTQWDPVRIPRGSTLEPLERGLWGHTGEEQRGASVTVPIPVNGRTRGMGLGAHTAPS